MPPPSRPNYSALRQTAQQVDAAATEHTVPEASQEAIAPPRREINVAELRLSYATGLQVQVNDGRLSATHRSDLLAAFDEQHRPAPQQDKGLLDAKELAASARSHEASEQTKAHEIDGPER